VIFPPTYNMNSIPTQNIPVNVFWAYDIPAFYDPNGHPLTYHSTALPSWLSLNSAVFFGTPTTVQTVTLTVWAVDIYKVSGNNVSFSIVVYTNVHTTGEPSTTGKFTSTIAQSFKTTTSIVNQITTNSQTTSQNLNTKNSSSTGSTKTIIIVVVVIGVVLIIIAIIIVVVFSIKKK